MLWVGTLGGGLHAFHDGKFVRFTARDGLLSDNISNILDQLKSLATQRTHESEALEIAVIQVLGEEALRYARRNRPSDS